jgi:hypothetical protein
MLARLGQQSGFTTNASGNVTPRAGERSERIGIAHSVSQRWSSVTIRTMSGGTPVSEAADARAFAAEAGTPAATGVTSRIAPRATAATCLTRSGTPRASRRAARRRPGTRARRDVHELVGIVSQRVELAFAGPELDVGEPRVRTSHHAGIALSPTHSANTSPGSPARLPVESSGTRLTPSKSVEGAHP